MDSSHILEAILELDNGLLTFNNGETYCFLHNNKWYPIHAIVNRAKNLANETSEYNLHNSIFKLHNLLNFVYIKKIKIENNNLLFLNTEEKMDLIKILANKIKKLTD